MGVNPYKTQSTVLAWNNVEWPYMLPHDAKPGRKPRKCIDLADDCLCPFCKNAVAFDGDKVSIGKKCSQCKAFISEFKRI